MAFNETITLGGAYNVADWITKVDAATNGLFFLFIFLIIFLLILGAFAKKYEKFERGLAVAGFITSFLGVFFTIIGIMSWKFIWISVAFFVIGFISKAFE